MSEFLFLWVGDNLINVEQIDHISLKGSILEIHYRSGLRVSITYDAPDIARREMGQIAMLFWSIRVTERDKDKGTKDEQ